MKRTFFINSVQHEYFSDSTFRHLLRKQEKTLRKKAQCFERQTRKIILVTGKEAKSMISHDRIHFLWDTYVQVSSEN